MKFVKFQFLDGDVPESPPHGVYVSQCICVARVCSKNSEFKGINRSLTAKLFTQGYQYYKLQKYFILISILSHSELTRKYNVGLKTLMLQGILEPLFYGGLVFESKSLFFDQLKINQTL